MSYFKERGITLDADALVAAMGPFNISSVKTFVDNDIQNYVNQDPSNASTRRATRERYHQSNLRNITEQYAAEVYRRQQRGGYSSESLLLNESRQFIKSAAAGCDVYPC
jgi:ribosome-binding protein aMBF1 (putative translation factor)